LELDVKNAATKMGYLLEFTAFMKRVQQFLDYADTQEPAVTTYRASDMVLAIHRVASYLNEEEA
jgi:hypothetical protein